MPKPAKPKDKKPVNKCPECNKPRVRKLHGKVAVYYCRNKDCEVFDASLCPTCLTARPLLKIAGKEEREYLCSNAECAEYAVDAFLPTKGETAEVDALKGKAKSARQSRFIGEVKRTEELLKFELYRHLATGIVYKRRYKDGAENKLADTKIPEEERLAALVAAIARKARSVKRANDVAACILKAIEKGKATADVEITMEEVPQLVWKSGLYQIVKKKSTWEKRVEGWQKGLSWRPKRGADAAERAKAKHEEVRGKIRITVQNGMKKADRLALVDGEDFETAYVLAYGKIKREIWPGDDEDPKDGAQAPLAEWQKAAYPDIAQA